VTEYHWAHATMAKIQDLLQQLDRAWPEDPDTADHETLEHCGELADQITDFMKQLDEGLHY
jgi:hypothetical protein